jgi:hypothetical protein
MSLGFAEGGLTLRDALVVVERAAAEARDQRHRRGVRFDPARLVIDVAGYEMDLERAANAAALLDWLIQIGLRTEPQRLRDVIDELDEACRTVFGTGIQGAYCPFAELRVVDWRRAVTRAARVEEDASSRTSQGERMAT